MTISLDRLIPIGTSHWPTDETVKLMRELSRLPYAKRKIVLLNIERIMKIVANDRESAEVHLQGIEKPFLLSRIELRRLRAACVL